MPEECISRPVQRLRQLIMQHMRRLAALPLNHQMQDQQSLQQLLQTLQHQQAQQSLSTPQQRPSQSLRGMCLSRDPSFPCLPRILISHSTPAVSAMCTACSNPNKQQSSLTKACVFIYKLTTLPEFLIVAAPQPTSLTVFSRTPHYISTCSCGCWHMCDLWLSPSS